MRLRSRDDDLQAAEAAAAAAVLQVEALSAEVSRLLQEAATAVSAPDPAPEPASASFDGRIAELAAGLESPPDPSPDVPTPDTPVIEPPRIGDDLSAIPGVDA